jgi:hypothetical protein
MRTQTLNKALCFGDISTFRCNISCIFMSNIKSLFRLITCLAYSSTLNMEATFFSKTAGSFRNTQSSNTDSNSSCIIIDIINNPVTLHINNNQTAISWHGSQVASLSAFPGSRYNSHEADVTLLVSCTEKELLC